jgi:hypothetical protein
LHSGGEPAAQVLEPAAQVLEEFGRDALAGEITGIPGSYGVICSAVMRPIALAAPASAVSARWRTCGHQGRP